MGLSINELLAELDQLKRPPTLAQLVERMERLAITLDDVAHVVNFSHTHYQRNLLHKSPHFHALILCWESGQRSPIHDHRGSACGMKILKGVATETLFERMPSDYIRAAGSHELFEGQVCGSFDADIHQVSNLQGDDAPLITLHIYSPPLMNMQIYRIEDNSVSEYVDPVLEFAYGAGI